MHTPIPVKITDPVTGTVTEDKLVPALIAEFCDNAKAAMRKDPKLRVIVDRFPQPIIWTLRCKTAASDGVRIAMNPVFADQLLMQGQRMSKETKIPSDKTKFFEFVFLHECFHEIYCHSKQQEFKEETRGGKNHTMANIAMDDEINRDIERCFNGRYEGVTRAINGMTDGIDYYPYEDWMQIFDDYYTGKRSLPEAEDEPDDQNYGNSSESEEDGDSQGTDGPGNDIQHSPAYEAGYAKALEDIKNGLIDPSNYSGFIAEAFVPSTQEEQEQFDAGYKAAIKAYNKNNQGKGQQSQNNQGAGNGQESQGGNQQSQDGNSQDSDSQENQNGGQSGNNSQDGQDEQEGQDQQGGGGSNSSGQDQTPGQDQIQDGNGNAGQPDLNHTEHSAGQGQGTAIDAGAYIDYELPEIFGGADRISTEELSKWAEEVGDDYTSSELTADPEKISEDYVAEHEAELNSIEMTDKNGNKSTLGKKIFDVLDKIKGRKAFGDWKTAMRRHLTEAMKSAIQFKRSKRILSQSDWRADFANPYKAIPKEISNSANVFYLIDNSGSMWMGDMFIQIFTEIVKLEKQVKVNKSALTYFSMSGDVDPNMIRMWDYTTPRNEVINKRMPQQGDRCGGTEIVQSVISVTKLKEPYYYEKDGHHTILFVFTDGEECTSEGLSAISVIPTKIKKDIVFVLINDYNSLVKYTKQLSKAGIPFKNIVCIERSSFIKKQ